VSPNKIWNITLTDDIDQSTLDQIKVVDNYGNNIDIEKKLTDSKHVTVEPVDGAWGRGVTYQLQTNNIKSVKGKLIKSPVTMAFTTGGIDYTPSGNYPNDESYIYKNMAGITWHDGSTIHQVNCYSVKVYNDDIGGITVAFDTDIWSTQNILNSSSSVSSIKMQLNAAYNYMKAKYPNTNIRVGLFLHEFLNKKVEGYRDDQITYNAKTNKYELLYLLGIKYPDGTEHYFDGEN
jgi:hypothetical protein